MIAQHPHDITLPTFSTPEIKVSVAEKQNQDPTSIAQSWLDNFCSVLSSGDASPSTSDFLTLTWDYRTIRGSSNLVSFLASNLSTGLSNLAPYTPPSKFASHFEHPIPDLEWVESMFTFETKVGKGKGMVRLAQGDDGLWKAHFISTSLQELKDYPEAAGPLRPLGGKNTLEGGMKAGNWQEGRERKREFLDEELTVFIVGAGQSGLNMGARLQALGISCLLIDKHTRIGDNWRHRYRTLVTHDPVQYTHMAYLPFPPTWPMFTPKDKLGDWFEAYASIMELNIWLQTRLLSATYSDASHHWTVTVKRSDNNTERTLKPKHIIFCTGHAGEPKIDTFPGQDNFRGTIYHGSHHVDATSHNPGSLAGKRVVVVGTENSGHDIAQNYHEAGASSVTMLQRRGTYVIQADKGLFMLHEGMYDESGPPIEDADVAGQSLPIPVQFALNVGLTARIQERERENLEGLERAGFKADFGNDGSGIYRKYITGGGGYCIDVGASRLIIDGKINVEQSPDGILRFEEGSVVLAGGRELGADVVVLATGYGNMRTSVEKVVGADEAGRCKDVWDLDMEGEVNAMWRPSGHPGLWFFGGSLALCRIYSRFLALQIKAVEEGLNVRT